MPLYFNKNQSNQKSVCSPLQFAASQNTIQQNAEGLAKGRGERPKQNIQSEF